MTLPNTPLTAIAGGVSAPMPTEPTVPQAPAQEASTLPVEPATHLDYNLQPLKVTSLAHYTEQPDGAERFRIS